MEVLTWISFLDLCNIINLSTLSNNHWRLFKNKLLTVRPTQRSPDSLKMIFGKSKMPACTLKISNSKDSSSS
jgi:hypothetical protein